MNDNASPRMQMSRDVAAGHHRATRCSSCVAPGAGYAECDAVRLGRLSQ